VALRPLRAILTCVATVVFAAASAVRRSHRRQPADSEFRYGSRANDVPDGARVRSVIE